MKIRILFLALLMTCGSAWADTVQILLDTNPITATPGQQITFTGSIVNNVTSPVDLNSISLTLAGLFTLDVTPFFAGPVSVDASAQTVSFDLFWVVPNNPYTDPFGLMTGTVTILGGIEGPGGYDPTTQDVLGSALFQVNVAAPAAVPEPSTLSMISGVALVLVLRQVFLRNRAVASGDSESLALRHRR